MKMFRFLLVASGLVGLVSIRVLEEKLFYDPFLKYFQQEFHTADFPVFVWWKLIVSHFFRFLLNLFFSAIFLQGLFGNKNWTLQAVFLMVLGFVVLLPIYLTGLYTQMKWGYLFTFSVRKFLIQPVFLLLFIAVFYYKKRLEKTKKPTLKKSRQT